MGGSLSTLVGEKSVPARSIVSGLLAYRALPDSFGLAPRLAPARAHPPSPSPRATTCCTPLLPRPPGRRLVAGWSGGALAGARPHGPTPHGVHSRSHSSAHHKASSFERTIPSACASAI